jgi:hypothetical protein
MQQADRVLECSRKLIVELAFHLSMAFILDPLETFEIVVRQA